MMTEQPVRDAILDFYRENRRSFSQYDAATQAVLNERWDTVLRQLGMIAERPDLYYFDEGVRSKAAELGAKLLAWRLNGGGKT